MAHSPLLRTVMRARLDGRAAALTQYELAMEDVCMTTMLQTTPNGGSTAPAPAPTPTRPMSPAPLTLDAEDWHEYRKAHDRKAARDARQARRTQQLRRHALREDRRIAKPLARGLRYRTFAYPKKLDARSTRRALPPARSVRYLKMVKMLQPLGVPEGPAARAYAEWRPPLRAEILAAEGGGGLLDPWEAPRLRGTPARVGGPSDEEEMAGKSLKDRTGLLNPRALRSTLTPEYVPKLHLRRARASLMGRSAEFAALVQRRINEGAYRLPEAEGGSSDDSSDESMVSLSPPGLKRKREGEEKETSRSPAAKKQRRSGATGQQQPPAPKTRPYIKPYDCRVHDARQLRAQGRHRFCLAQQRLPRVEQPLFGAMRIAAPEGDETAPPVVAPSTDDSEGFSESSTKSVDSAPRKMLVTKPQPPTPEELALKQIEAISIPLPTRIPEPPKKNQDINDKKRKRCEVDDAPETDCSEALADEDSPIGEIGPEDAQRYRKWRKTSAKPLFAARNQYVRCRMYKELTKEKEITLQIRDLLKFWEKA